MAVKALFDLPGAVDLDAGEGDVADRVVRRERGRRDRQPVGVGQGAVGRRRVSGYDEAGVGLGAVFGELELDLGVGGAAVDEADLERFDLGRSGISICTAPMCSEMPRPTPTRPSAARARP